MVPDIATTELSIMMIIFYEVCPQATKGNDQNYANLIAMILQIPLPTIF
jgi:hypothetical protein